MADLVLMPDVEELLSSFLRAQEEITTLVGDRVYTDMPATREYPLVVLRRTGGGPQITRPQWLDNPVMTVECHGTTHKQAARIALTVVAVMGQRFVGFHSTGAVTQVLVESIAYEPDEAVFDTTGHSRPRYLITASLLTRP